MLNPGLTAGPLTKSPAQVFKLCAFSIDLLRTDWKKQSEISMANMETKDEDAEIEAQEAETQPMIGARRGSTLDKITGVCRLSALMFLHVIAQQSVLYCFSMLVFLGS